MTTGAAGCGACDLVVVAAAGVRRIGVAKSEQG